MTLHDGIVGVIRQHIRADFLNVIKPLCFPLITMITNKKEDLIEKRHFYYQTIVFHVIG